MFKFPPLKSIGIAFIAGFFAVQIISLLLTALFPSIPILRGGPIVLVFLLAIAVISLFVLGINYDELKTKENIFFALLIFGLLIAGYYYLPKYVPQIFTISPGISTSIKSAIGSIVA